ncbi:hypothetical protein K3179_02495 [Qipengyuania sp. GH38]|uniref:hypothetical protein n=1 Tax=Qipengyuania intermedia TaxID=2867244 RepID=UPI001C867B05|nr:hypothetical protein [Qipengyuania intermedia]MBX7513410.1 hypothetical protein [Qipengyuania intermedia]
MSDYDKPAIPPATPPAIDPDADPKTAREMAEEGEREGDVLQDRGAPDAKDEKAEQRMGAAMEGGKDGAGEIAMDAAVMPPD